MKKQDNTLFPVAQTYCHAENDSIHGGFAIAKDGDADSSSKQVDVHAETSDIVVSIQRYHAAATAAATTAISYAIEAGRLLAGVKAQMPHGEFGAWVQDKCAINYRTCRRYLLAFKRLAHLPESNWPSMANLEKAIAATIPKKSQPLPTSLPSWLPPVGRAVQFVQGARVWHAWAIKGIARDGLEREFMLAMLVDVDTGMVDFMKRGMLGGEVLTLTLADLGLSDPASVDWVEVDAANVIALHAELRAKDSGHEA